MKIRVSFLSITILSLLVCGCSNKTSTSSEPNVVIPSDYVAELPNNMCFDEEQQLYNYAPCVMVDGYEAHIYYCTSMISGKNGADDRIGYRHGLKKNGVWYWGPKTLALDLGEGPTAWDRTDVCDPDVVKGEFVYNGEIYNYLMAYLGCWTPGNYENAYGFAVSKTPAGPFIRVEGLCPLYDYWENNPDYEYKGHDDPATSIWGWGQCCLISYDQRGKVLVFDTGRSETGQTTELWDFSDLNNPTMLWREKMSNRGITDLYGNQDTICNASIVYDQRLKCFYMLSDVHPFDETTIPDNLPSETRIVMINDFGSESMGDCFREEKALWTKLGSISEDVTGFPKNSNACFERDPYGWMINPESSSIDILYSAVPAGVSDKWIFAFRIYRMKFEF